MNNPLLLTLTVLGVPILVFSAFVLLVFVITLREKRMMWYLQPMSQSEQIDSRLTDSNSQNPYQAVVVEESLPITPTAMAQGKQLNALGYTYLGPYRHSKGGIYRIRYDLMLSPDRLILAIIGGGKLMSMKAENVALISLEKSTSGKTRVHESISNEGTFTPNWADLKTTIIFNQASAREMDQLHRSRFALFQPKEFSYEPVQDYYKFRETEQQIAIDNGSLRLIDTNVTLPTLKGALYAVWAVYSFQIGRRLYPHQIRLRRCLKRLAC